MPGTALAFRVREAPEVETAFKAGTVDTGPASALQGTDLASSILHQLRQHLTAPVSARAGGASRSVSAWGPPPARPICQTGRSLGPPSLAARRLRPATLRPAVGPPSPAPRAP